MTFQDPWYRYPSGGIDTLLMFFKMQDSSSHFRYQYSSRVSIPKGGTDTLQRWYRYPLSRMGKKGRKTSPTAPNKVQRSPTARITFGTIKQASKHQGKTNASLYNIIMIKNCLSA
ncbi:hypothetical protein GQ457_05G016030 [Hibiscus cannabinus]